MATHFKNSVLSQPESVFKIGFQFQFHTHNAKENILSEKNIFRFLGVEKRIFDQKLQIFGFFIKISNLFHHLDINFYTQKKPFRDEMFSEICVRENVYPLGQPTCFVLWQF